MASPVQYIPIDTLIARISHLYSQIRKLENLEPSEPTNALVANLISLCTSPSSIDIASQPEGVQRMRQDLIRLAGQAEGLLELEFSSSISKLPKPLNNLNRFPYYDNYSKTAEVEYEILKQHGMGEPRKVAFVGSGAMPMTSIFMAARHMTRATIYNFDRDEAATEAARRLVGADEGLARRMRFETREITSVREELGQYDCLFVAALVGMKRAEKARVIEHLKRYVKRRAVLLVRSAKGARAFLYPTVEEDDLTGFSILSIFHPSDDVINSVIILQKP